MRSGSVLGISIFKTNVGILPRNPFCIFQLVAPNNCTTKIIRTQITKTRNWGKIERNPEKRRWPIKEFEAYQWPQEAVLEYQKSTWEKRSKETKKTGLEIDILTCNLCLQKALVLFIVFYSALFYLFLFTFTVLPRTLPGIRGRNTEGAEKEMISPVSGFEKARAFTFLKGYKSHSDVIDTLA